MKRMLTCLLALALSLGMTASAEGYTPGTYAGSAMGFGGPLEVQVEVSEDAIVSVHVGGNNETLGIGSGRSRACRRPWWSSRRRMWRPSAARR